MSAAPQPVDEQADVAAFWRRLARLPKPSQTRLTPELLREILEPIASRGCHAETGAALAGVPPPTFDRWKQLGTRDLARGEDTIYAELVRGLTVAKAHSTERDLGVIQRAEAWTSKAWILERVEPEKYGQRRDVQVTHRALPMVDPDLLTVEELDTLTALLRKASPDPNAQGLNKDRRPVLELMPADVVEDVVEAPAPRVDAEKPGP